MAVVDPDGRPMVVYDGECPRCAKAAHWVTSRAPVTAVPWQEVGDLARLGLTRRQVDESVWWVEPDGTHGGAAAVARALRAAGGPWRLLGWALDRPLLRPVAAAAYRVAARHRPRSS